MAIGSQTSQIPKMDLVHGMDRASLGLTSRLGLPLASSDYGGVSFEVSPVDLIPFCGMAALLITAARCDPRLACHADGHDHGTGVA